MPTSPDISTDESIDATSSWQSVVDSESAVDHSECSTGDNVTRVSNSFRSRTSGDGQGYMGEISRARLYDYAQDHRMYYFHGSWNRDPVSLQDPPCIPTGNNDIWHGKSSHDHSRSDSHNNSQIIDEGSFVHFSDHPSSSSIPARDPSGFTPINQNHSVPSPLKQSHRSPPSAENVPLVVDTKSPPQPQAFVNIGPSDFE